MSDERIPVYVSAELFQRLEEWRRGGGKCCGSMRLNEKTERMDRVGRLLAMGNNNYPLPILRMRCQSCGSAVVSCIDPSRDYDGVRVYPKRNGESDEP